MRKKILLLKGGRFLYVEAYSGFTHLDVKNPDLSNFTLLQFPEGFNASRS